MVVSVLLLALLVRTVPMGDLVDTLLGIRLGPLGALVLLHGVVLVIRVRRWEWIVAVEPPAGLVPSSAAWDAVFIGWFANFALPAKVGELARPWVYSRATGRPFAEVLGTVALERVFDLLALGGLFWLAFGVLPGATGLPEWFPRFAELGGAASLGGLVGLGVLWRWGPKEGTIGRFRAGLDVFGRPVALARVLALTAIAWAAEVIAVALTLIACGAEGLEAAARFAASASQVVVSTLAVAVPAAPGGIGVDQWATIVALRPFAVLDEVATAISLVDMAAVLLWVVPLGVLAFGRRGGRKLTREIEAE